MSKQSNSSGFWAFVMGGLIGAVAGILYAPRSGKETRELLVSEGEELKVKTATTLQKAQESALESFKETQRRAEELNQEARERIAQLQKIAQDMAAEQKESLEKGVSEAKETLKKG